MIFRFARHTADLPVIKNFYQEILGFDLLGEFKDHDNYDGIFLGIKDLPWHLEFTQSDSPENRTFGEDDILVFYPSTREAFNELVNRIRSSQVKEIQPKNPYWKNNGLMIQDPDGYRIVISCSQR